MRYTLILLAAFGVAFGQTYRPTPNPGDPYLLGPVPNSIPNGQCFGNNGGVLGGFACSGGTSTGTPAYSQAVSAQTTLSVTAATHGQGTKPFAFCFDNSTPAVYVSCAYTVNTSGDIVFSWSPAFTGKVIIDGATGGFANPMSAVSDIIVGGAAGIATRLAKGTANQVLSMDGTATNIIWAAAGGGGGTPCTTTALSLQFNSGGTFGCVAEFTYASSTVTASSAGKLDLSAAPVTTGFKLPSAAGAIPVADGIIAENTTNHTLVYGLNGTTTMVSAVAATGTGTATTCTNQAVTVVSGIAIPTCSTITPAFATGNTSGSGNFVLVTSPTLVTPAIGVATGTSLALGGATIGSDALGITGTATISGASVFGSAITAGTDSSVAGTLQLANSAAAAHTILKSGATTTNTIAGFTVAPADTAIVNCSVSGTTCTLHDTAITVGSAPLSLRPGSGAVELRLQAGGGAIAGFAGALTLIGADNTNSSATSQGGNVGIWTGGETGATQGLMGLLDIGSTYIKGTTVTLYNLQDISSGMTVTDCAANSVDFIGVAWVLSTATTIKVATVPGSQIPINATAAVTVGHTVCTGATAGKVTDSGGLGVCTAGQEVGIVLATSGIYHLGDGNSVTLSTTLPLILYRPQ